MKAVITDWSVTADMHTQTGPNKEGTFPNNNISILLQKGVSAQCETCSDLATAPPLH